MNNELMRFSVAMPEDLLVEFDEYVARRGLAANRSEAVRDLVREALDSDACADPNATAVGTLTISFSHHANDLQENLDHIQHEHFGMIVSSMHVHLDAHNCLEVIVMRGQAAEIQRLADRILGTKGVTGGKLVLTMAEALP